jgi:hypothetical protein
MISRRTFLTLAATALAAPRPLFANTKDEVPSLLDHILLGCNDLDHGIAFVEQHTGVRAAFGGVHPGRGTRNALLSLGERRYLEIIAPDPRQQMPDVAPMVLRSASQLLSQLQSLREPRLVGWAAHPGDIKALADRLAKIGIAADGPTPGSRKRPDGKLLQWKTLNLKDTVGGLLPFFIEWSADSAHPSADSPKGCSVIRFEALTPNAEALAATTKQLDLDLRISKADKAQLRAVIASPKGELILTS